MRDFLLEKTIPVLVASLCFYCAITPLDTVYLNGVRLFRFVFRWFL